MTRPVCARNGPYAVMVEQGREYLWCACGRSANQPWCDGAHADAHADSHGGSEFEPITFTAPISAEFHMCGCKRSDNKPYCFGNCRGHHRRGGWSFL